MQRNQFNFKKKVAPFRPYAHIIRVRRSLSARVIDMATGAPSSNVRSFRSYNFIRTDRWWGVPGHVQQKPSLNILVGQAFSCTCSSGIECRSGEDEVFRRRGSTAEHGLQ